MIRRAAPFALLVLFTQGCQTAGTKGEAELPAALAPLVVPCLPADGALSMQAFSGDSMLGSLDGEWIARTSGDWDIELTNPVGQTMLGVSRRGAVISTKGPLARRLPPLAVRPSGFLQVNGHLVAIKANEVPCLLQGAFPKTWINKLTDSEQSGAEVSAAFADTVRSGTLSAPIVDNKISGDACATVTWRTFLFFHQDLTWCRKHGTKRAVELSGYEDYKIKWTAIDEH